MIKIVAYQGLVETGTPAVQKTGFLHALRVAVAVVLGVAAVVAAFFFLAVVFAVLVAIALVVVAVFSVRRFLRRTRMKLENHGHQVTRVTVLPCREAGTSGSPAEYWSDNQGPPPA